MEISAIRNLDAAEAAYQRGLGLNATEDKQYQAGAILHIGMVHHQRFRESRQRGEPAEAALKHAQAAEQHYHQALALCPPTALTALGPIHNQLGVLFAELGQTESARAHFEKTAQYFEQTGNRYHAGTVRHNMAVMYLEAAERESTPARQCDLLHRAQAYAQAALRDYQHYQGRAATDEAKAQQLLAAIAQALTKLPPS
jgi:tetratricopeptide (TPR) repeat protein